MYGECYPSVGAFQPNLNMMEEYEKSRIKVEEARAKSGIKLEEYEKKLWLKAWEEESCEEHKLSKTEEVVANAEGEITIQTKNTVIETKPHKGANFKSTGCNAVYRDIASSDVGVLAVKIWIGQDEKNVYLNLKKITDGRYILRKFAASGAMIYACNQCKKKEYAVMIAQFMFSGVHATEFIPFEYGWYQNEKGELKFCDKNCMKEILRYAE